MKKLRIRIGIKLGVTSSLGKLFPNAGIVVAYMTPDQYSQAKAAIDTVNGILGVAATQYAGLLVCDGALGINS